MNAAMVESDIRTGIRMQAGGAIAPAAGSAVVRVGALTTTTKKLGKTTR